ncbi:MAG TPA: AIR synthase related protein [Bdellovibrio sp.]|nr:AIR synthase related protein [Bdellovibrio sp.]
MKPTREYSELKKILGPQLRSPKQKNNFFESDCEILQLDSKNYFTTSIDSVGEEISIGLYKEIETWAWLTVMSSVSDLAASGSTPLGLTVSAQWAFDTDKETQKKFYHGVHKACHKANVPLIGGDSGYAKDHVFTSSIFGHSTTPPLQRIPIRDGDCLILLHQKNIGIGPALAFQYLMKPDQNILPEKLFRPCPEWKLVKKLRPWCRASIDTSDGLATSLYNLATLNDLGFEIQWQESINHPQALKFCSLNKLSPILLWLGDLGDLQTLLVVPEKNLRRFFGKNMTLLGRFQKKKSFELNYKNQKLDLPVKEITSCPRDAEDYARLWRDLNKQLLHKS